MTGASAPGDFLKKRHDLVSLGIVILHLAFVFLPLYLALRFAPDWKLILFSAWFGIGMNGLLNLFHECAHLHVFRKPLLSTILGRWLLGPLVLADFDGYQKRHWRHHRELGKETDPKYVYRTSIRGFRFVALLLRCIVLVEAVRKFGVQTPSPGEGPSAPSGSRWILRALLVQAALFGSLWGPALLLSGNLEASFWKAAWVYGVVYLYGIAAVTVWISSLRAIAEHQPGPDGAMTEGNAALRNFSYGMLTGFVLGAYGFQDHATHHWEPGIPYYRLRSKTRELAAENPGFSPTSPYEKVLFTLIR